ncbi:spore cortex biosynthesis protein YabQ [Salipaludibacillus aurantiacus]|uniref:Spore cortex biosynthesis protein YabQ n=1 Tax=Salipaludibacillus aurantiacus TaxID=1601833 RepID=A0A1H9X3X5_9BACI|nr:spore cortex biosynthesis protein YabQ [Salipaludibacillus aurantiacus]SES40840.1 spore cortex biosynthesis protein YabQ [Salipaludibacillus aurantiacus]
MSLDIQMASMLASAVMGLWLGSSLDTYERVLGKRKAFRWTRALNDFLFWVAQGLIYFGVLLYVNNGEVRFYLFLAVLFGYAAYRALFERTYRRFLETLLRIISGIYQFLVRFTYVVFINPTKGLLKLVVHLGMILVIAIWGILSFFLKWTFWPIFKLIKFADDKSGQPFKKQRLKIAALGRSLGHIFNKFRKKP